MRPLPDFESCVEGLWPLAAKRNISRASFDKYTHGLTPDLRIMDLIDAQPEFTKAFWDYLDILVSDARIAERPRNPRQEQGDLRQGGEAATASTAISSPRSGASSRTTARSAATGRCCVRPRRSSCIGRRQAYFRDEFLSALEILHRGDLKPEQLIGSWAGAFGPTQFMPTSFKRYAVDFDGDGRRDVVSSAADLIASTANNLKKDGWVPSETWGYEVVVPKGFNYLLADRSKQLTLAEWEAHGIKRAGGKPFPHPHEKAYLLVPAGNQGPGFLMLHNFRVIMKYNPAEAYAMAIGHLADRLRGGDAVRAGLAAARAGAVARGAARNAGIAEPQGLRYRRAERPAGRQGARCGPRLPGLGRACSGWLCLGHDPGAAAGPLTKRRPSG